MLCMDELGVEYVRAEPTERAIRRGMVTHVASYPMVLVEDDGRSRMLHGECPDIGEAVRTMDGWQTGDILWGEAVALWRRQLAL